MRFIPDETNINFLGKRWVAFVISTTMIIATIFIIATRGLNFGIDFTGGILIDAQFEQEVELVKMRNLLKDTDIGDIQLQTFGKDNDILIRVGQTSGAESDRIAAVNTIKEVLANNFPGNIDYRKVDYVGPKVGGELIKDGALSLVLAFAAIMLYVWVRFEWQYGVGAILALIHDAFLTVGFFSFTQYEFNLSSIAAILTIIGYSINDSVVIFDRVRDNVRKYKKMSMPELLNHSINDNLTRTLMTSFTTIVAIFALVLVGGEVIRGFSMATLFGIVVGTYSSIYIASPVLIYLNLRSEKPATA